jgi:S-adenosylmethionine-diacylgycerolhomoserine-N-methlytransferase
MRTLRALLRGAGREGGAGSPESLSAFYQPQARDYDDFRERLLHGRAELIAALPLKPGAVWVDLGGGTARTLEYLGEGLRTLDRVYVVDLAAPLLAIARERIARHGWTNVTTLASSVTALDLPSGCADVVTCSYSLTMMDDWKGAIATARRLLRTGGTIGVVDFYVSHAVAIPQRQHGLFTRSFWPWWFRHSDVWLSADHLPALASHFDPVVIDECAGRVPYLPGAKVPYYRFIGRRQAATAVRRATPARAR